MAEAYLGIGGNLGDRERTLTEGTRALDSEPGIRVLRASGVYETAPVGVEDQPGFLNAVLHVRTELTARQLLCRLLEVEKRFGRHRLKKWGPRTLDLDILLYDSEIIHEEGLDVPHPYMQERGFVLIPLCDLIPDDLHPALGRKVRDMADAAGDEGVKLVEGLCLLSDGQEAG